MLTVPKAEIKICLPFAGADMEDALKASLRACFQLVTCAVNVRVIFTNSCRISSSFRYKDILPRGGRSKVVYQATCGTCFEKYIGKTKKRLDDQEKEHFLSLTQPQNYHSSIADHMRATGHSVDHGFEILARGRTDIHCRIKETLFIHETNPTLNGNEGSEKLWLF